MEELWKDVVGFEGFYQVSSAGRVKRVSSDRILAGSKNQQGYVIICMSKHNNPSSKFAHAIVAEAFIGPRPDGMHIDHIDGVRDNNRLENLRYVTPMENNRAMFERQGGTFGGAKNGYSKLSAEQVAEIVEAHAKYGRYYGAATLAKKFGVSKNAIAAAAHGKTYKAEYEKCPAKSNGEYKTIQSQLVELQRENARLREDAERYRYAQEHLRIGLAKFDSWSHCDCDFTDMDDAAIDAHRAKKDSYQ